MAQTTRLVVNGTHYNQSVTPKQLGIKSMLAQVNYTDKPFTELYDLNRPLT